MVSTDRSHEDKLSCAMFEAYSEIEDTMEVHYFINELGIILIILVKLKTVTN
jgi:hypothetical protein